MDFVVLAEGFCAFYNQNQLNLILLRPTLANRGRIADIAEIRLKNHTEREELRWNYRLHSFVTVARFKTVRNCPILTRIFRVVSELTFCKSLNIGQLWTF